MIRYLFLGLLAAIVTGCQVPTAVAEFSFPKLLSQLSVTSINQLQQSRPRVPTQVNLRGKVQKLVPLAGATAYQLQDSSGSIWVISPNRPNVGDILLIRGQTRYEAIIVTGQDRGEVYIQEQEVIERQPQPPRPLGTNLLPENRP
jgi:hypothetical protein